MNQAVVNPQLTPEQKLELSPLFQLSLASKELFHSNMIAWLSERFPSDMAKVLGLEDTIGRVQREKGNIDLTFTLVNRKKVILENKVKSTPDLKQLEGYSAKNPGVKGILLSLIQPTFMLPPDWQPVTYRMLKANLRLVLLPTLQPSSYDYFLVKDYIEFIENLELVCQKYAIKNHSDPVQLSASARKNLQQLRIHDLVEKQRASYLEQEIRNLSAEINLSSAPKPTPKTALPDRNSIYSSHGLTHTYGLVESKIVKKTGLDWTVLGIQLQGSQLRFVVECPDMASAQRAFDLYQPDWVAPFVTQTRPSVAAPRYLPAKHTKGTPPCKFAPGFVYDYIKLTDKTTVQELLDTWEDAINLAI